MLTWNKIITAAACIVLGLMLLSSPLTHDRRSRSGFAALGQYLNPKRFSAAYPMPLPGMLIEKNGALHWDWPDETDADQSVIGQLRLSPLTYHGALFATSSERTIFSTYYRPLSPAEETYAKKLAMQFHDANSYRSERRDVLHELLVVQRPSARRSMLSGYVANSIFASCVLWIAFATCSCAVRCIRRTRVSVGDFCPTCRYDLGATFAQRCPECGNQVARYVGATR